MSQGTSQESFEPTQDPLSQTTLIPQILRKTHTTPALIQAYKDYPITMRLTKNKEIDDANKTRVKYAIDRIAALTADPNDAEFQRPTSRPASLLTIEDEELEELAHPTILDHLKDTIPLSFISKILAIITRKETVSANKRKSDNDTSGSDKLTKRQCMDGDQIVLKAPLASVATAIRSGSFACGNTPKRVLDHQGALSYI